MVMFVLLEPPSMLLGRVKIVTLRVGARAKEGKGAGEGRKKYVCPISLCFGKLCKLANRAPDWCGLGEVD